MLVDHLLLAVCHQYHHKAVKAGDNPPELEAVHQEQGHRGFVTGFDSFVVVLVSDGKQQMIYKHAISTLAPMKPLTAAATTA